MPGPDPPADANRGDPTPSAASLIRVRVEELKHLFHSIDPSPFRERDLDPRADEFIVGWARDFPRNAPIALEVHLDRSPDPARDHAVLRAAINEYFTQRAQASRQRLRQTLRVGRVSLAIGLVCVAASIGLGTLLADGMPGRTLGFIIRESLIIGAWVAMWRPLEIFLYDWWQIRAEAALFDRLAAMPVRVVTARAADQR